MAKAGAQVGSVEAIRAFRVQLILYLKKAKPMLEDVSAEAMVRREWVRTDRRVHWENEMRRRKKVLEQAEQAYFNTRFSNIRTGGQVEQIAVQRAQRAVEEAEEKLRKIKRWNLDFDRQVGPLLKQLEALHTVYAQDLAQAARRLDELDRALAVYLETGAEPSAAKPVESAEPGEEPPP